MHLVVLIWLMKGLTMMPHEEVKLKGKCKVGGRETSFHSQALPLET